MKHHTHRIAWAAAMMLSVSVCMTGCSQKAETNTSTSTNASTNTNTGTDIQSEQKSSVNQNTEQTSEESSDESSKASETSSRAVYDEDDIASQYNSFDAEINLNESSATVTGSKESVEIKDKNITITKGGTYHLSGSLNNGQLNVTGTEKVKLYLDGVSIENKNGAAIVCTNEKRTIITLAEGTENTLSDGGNYTIPNEDTVAVIYAKDKLTINGNGILTVNGKVSDGIISKDDLKITGGIINVNAENNGIKGTDSVAICGGMLNVTAGNDGIKSTKADNTEKGWIAIDGGDITVTADGDGIQAENTLEITAGKLSITTNGEIDTSSSDEFSMMPGGHGGFGSNDEFGGGRPDDFRFSNDEGFPNAQPTADITETNADDNNTLSSKGIKSGSTMTVTGGTVQVNSTDHCVHSSNALNISAGNLSLSSSMAKGISSHGDMTISGDETIITIEKCTEGIESKSVMNIDGGNIRILDASDDGLNTGGNTGSDHTMNINGGTIYINSAADGTDSNGDTNFNGGLLIVSGPVSGGDGSIDGDGTMTLNGGTILGLSSRGMMEYPAGCMVTTSANASAGDMISVLDSNGELIITIKTNKDVSDIIYADGTGSNMASYKLVTGGSFEGTLCEDGWAVSGKIENGTECTWSQAETANSGMMGGGFGGRRDNMPSDMENMTPPGNFNGERPEKPNDIMPEHH